MRKEKTKTETNKRSIVRNLTSNAVGIKKMVLSRSQKGNELDSGTFD